MAATSRERVRFARSQLPEAALMERALALPAAPALRLTGSFDLIAEVKLRSPATGKLRSASDEDVAARVTTYAHAGAAAVSVLTEPSRFDGSLAHLEQASRALAAHGVPAMRKDFLVDPYQALEARAAGAGGVLIILRMLSPAERDGLIDCAIEQGLFALLEAFDEADIEAAHGIVEGRGATARAGQLLVGLNCRDLATLEIVPRRLEALAPLLPRQVPRVAESGIVTPEDAGRAAAAGYTLALVGSALMTSADGAALARAMIESGRCGSRSAA
jgi:indole-3-glycerol phosphate synthase